MARDLRLGLNLGYWAGGPPPGAAETIQEADRLGFDSVWTAEAYGSDALMPLAWWGAATQQIKLGTAIVQISARTPAATAIQESDLGLTPSNDGKLIRLPIPQLTEERRKELVKVVRNMAEEHRVAVREIRRDAMRHLKELVDNGEVGADDEHRAEGRVQELTDEHTKQIDELLKHKEAEVMEV